MVTSIKKYLRSEQKKLSNKIKSLKITQNKWNSFKFLKENKTSLVMKVFQREVVEHNTKLLFKTIVQSW